MVKNNCLFILFFCLLGITGYAQKVSNINYRQELSTIIISYDLETKTPCKINLFVSTNGGKTWQGPLKKVTGDVGAKIVSGSHTITWNVLEEFEELRGDKIQFQVRADRGTIETVVIGTQEWTTKNLNVSKYRNGDIIPEVKDTNKWENLTTGAWCYYNNDPKNGVIYGKLYNWYAVNDPRGLAPEGFHIPSDAEWTTLTNYLGGDEGPGGKMKATGTSLWSSPNEDATNSSGFTGLPGGYFGSNGPFPWGYGSNGPFYNVGSNGYWWSSSEFSNTTAWFIILYYSGGGANSYSNSKPDGCSVRCLKD